MRNLNGAEDLENEMAGVDSVEKLEDVIVRSAEQVAGQIRAAKDAISTVIFGQDRVIENTLVTILSGGHALLIGVPGLAKTKLVETLGITLGLDAKRIQFTPDLMPSDILGAEVLDESSSGKRSFRFMSWRRKIRWSRKAPTRCRRPSSIAS